MTVGIINLSIGVLIYPQLVFFATGLNKLLVGFDTNEATARCTFAYSEGPMAEPVLFIGETKGKIVPPRGPAVFGWDPCFEADESGQTSALYFPL